jgi:hypothetical protein
MADAAAAPDDRSWRSRWIRALLAVGLTAVAIVIGFRLSPGKPLARDLTQPTIFIFASHPDVSAIVTMSSNPYAPASRAAASPSATGSSPRSGWQFQLTLKVLSPQRSPVTFLVLLSDFPRLLASNGVMPLKSASTPPPASALAQPLTAPALDAVGRADFLAVDTFHPAPSAALLERRPSEPTVKIVTQYSVVSRSSGAELQVAFPLVEDEKPAPVPDLPPTQPVPVSELLAGYQPVPSRPGRDCYEPDLEPGNMQFRPAVGVNLADYQTLAGTPPVSRAQGDWSWAGTGDISLLSQDALTADVAQQHLFWAGVAWGVAGAGFIAAVLELVSASQKQLAARRKQPPAAQSAGTVTATSEAAAAEPAPEAI